MDKNFVAGVRQMMGELNDSHFSANFLSKDYADTILDAIAEDVAQDIMDCADPENYNYSDVRLAISRVLLKRLGIAV